MTPGRLTFTDFPISSEPTFTFTLEASEGIYAVRIRITIVQSRVGTFVDVYWIKILKSCVYLFEMNNSKQTTQKHISMFHIAKDSLGIVHRNEPVQSYTVCHSSLSLSSSSSVDCSPQYSNELTTVGRIFGF